MESIFSALADSNRRQVVELLHEKNSTLLELHENFSISFQALSKHIKILEEAQLVQKEKKGKYRILSLNRSSMEPVLKWISYYSNFWNESFDKLELLIQKQNQDNDQ
ncbi:ArsR/SmtB family transcription factor [Flagellimonas onchidii]|uniref:ArsR/SmtB family transcription factor n=1 Tax=Flagellimonas onchidii TaxID=2562684 RepID=UPI0010A62165|nr:metalloregulator ArsR/SmtB family transcription factor [Allomuricauda onchidii]